MRRLGCARAGRRQTHHIGVGERLAEGPDPRRLALAIAAGEAQVGEHVDRGLVALGGAETHLEPRVAACAAETSARSKGWSSMKTKLSRPRSSALAMRAKASLLGVQATCGWRK